MSTITGVLTLGYKGGVGNHFGYAILIAIAGACLFLGAVTAAFRDSNSAALAEAAGLDSAPELTASPRGSYWPIFGAFGVAVTTVGLAASPTLVYVGIGLLGITTFEWALSAWADRVSNDIEVNRAARRRVMLPFEVPVIGATGIALFVLAISRVLLAVSELAVYLIFGGVALIVLIVAFVLSARPKLNRSVVAGLCVAGALAVLAGGVVSTIVGPQESEPHPGEHEEEEHEGARLVAPAETIIALEGVA